MGLKRGKSDKADAWEIANYAQAKTRRIDTISSTSKEANRITKDDEFKRTISQTTHSE